MTYRYYVSPTPNSNGSYSVIDRLRQNRWGERYAVYSYLTYEQARADCDRLNRASAQS